MQSEFTNRTNHAGNVAAIWSINNSVISEHIWTVDIFDRLQCLYMNPQHMISIFHSYVTWLLQHLHAQNMIHLPTMTNCLSHEENSKKNHAIVSSTIPTTMKPVVATHSPGWSVVTQTSGWLRGCWHVNARPSRIEPAETESVFVASCWGRGIGA